MNIVLNFKFYILHNIHNIYFSNLINYLYKYYLYKSDDILINSIYDFLIHIIKIVYNIFMVEKKSNLQKIRI